MKWTKPLESLLSSYGFFALKSPLLALLCPLFVVVVMSVALKGLEQDTAFESFFDHESDLYRSFIEFRETFGRDEYYLVMVETDDFYQESFLQGFTQLHQQLEQMPFVDSVESLVNARFIHADSDELTISELLEELPAGQAEFLTLHENIQNNPAYHRRLISDDHKTLAMLVTAIPYKLVANENGEEVATNLTPNELAGVVQNIRDVIDEYGAFSTQIRIGGAAVVGVTLNQAVQEDFIIFTATSLALVTLFLIVMFRRLSGVVLPLIVIIAGLITTIGMMPVLGYPIQVTTAILPSFLLAVCVGDSVHMLSFFYRDFDRGISKAEALVGALRHSGIPMLFTSITTSAGLVSFAYADLVPVASLGLFGAIGAMVAFVFTVLLLPPLVAISRIRRKSGRKEIIRNENLRGLIGEYGTDEYYHDAEHDHRKEDYIHRFLSSVVDFVQRFPEAIVATSAVIFVAGLVAASQIPFSNDSMQWFDPEAEVRQAIAAAEAVLAGSNQVEILIDTGVSGGAVDPDLWVRLDSFFSKLPGKKINGIPVGSVTSLADIIKEANRAMHNNDKSSYTIPASKELLAQELLLVEFDKRDELYKFMDSDQRRIRVTAVIPWIDSIEFPAFVEELERQYYQNVGRDHKIEVTGIVVLLGHFFTQMIAQIINSYVLAGIIITLLMIVLLGDIKLGLISMLPNLIPIVSLMGIMWVFDFPLDMFTMLIGSIVIGLSVDDTVHFMHGFRKHLNTHNDVRKAVESTILTTGRALLITSLVLCSGFLTYTLSSLNNLFDFGVLTASCTLIALFADLLLAPSLMLLLYTKRQAVEADEIQAFKFATTNDYRQAGRTVSVTKARYTPTYEPVAEPLSVNATAAKEDLHDPSHAEP